MCILFYLPLFKNITDKVHFSGTIAQEIICYSKIERCNKCGSQYKLTILTKAAVLRIHCLTYVFRRWGGTVSGLHFWILLLTYTLGTSASRRTWLDFCWWNISFIKYVCPHFPYVLYYVLDFSMITLIPIFSFISRSIPLEISRSHILKHLSLQLEAMPILHDSAFLIPWFRGWKQKQQ